MPKSIQKWTPLIGQRGESPLIRLTPSPLFGQSPLEKFGLLVFGDILDRRLVIQ